MPSPTPNSMVKKFLKIATDLFSKRLKVKPLSSNLEIIFNSCLNVVPSFKDQSVGIPNSDLHLYITAKYAN